ncbi:MAG: hypothetical protein HW393_671 [Dehalococcoidia bacterium]|nr:hypothetical protein [Dehalococcoidia bacterium]
MNLIRCTIVDRWGAISLVAHADALPSLVAACTANPSGLDELLALSEPYYRGLREYVEAGLAVFDEMNVRGRYGAIHKTLRLTESARQPVFRVVDGVTREASLRPVNAGAIIFNLRAKRIVQIMNSYREIRRIGHARIFDGLGYTDAVFSYRLPGEWALVP